MGNGPTRRALLAGAFGALSAGCAGPRGRPDVTVTPAPVPTPATETVQTAGAGRGFDVMVRNESSYRRTVAVSVERDDSAVFTQTETVLAGRGVRFEDAMVGRPPTSDAADRVTVVVRRATGAELGRLAVQTTDTALVVVTLLPDETEWATRP